MKNRLRELRKTRNITQQELASMLAVSRQTVNAIENERYDPSLSLAFELALVFETSIEQLFSYTTES